MSVALDSAEMQAKSLALMVTHPQVLTAHRGNVSASYYDSREFQTLTTCILNFYDKYRRPPVFSELSSYVKQNYCKTKEDRIKYSKIIKSLRTHAKKDLSFVKDQFLEFLKYHTYKNMVLASLKCLEKKDLDTIPELYRRSLTAMNKSTSSLKYFDNPHKRISTTIPRTPVPTGIESLDDALEGGLGRGEMTVVHAFTNVGKTTFVINLIVHAVKLGHTCVHMTTEETIDQIASRYDVRFLGKHRDTIRKYPKRYSKKLKTFSKNGGSIEIVDIGGWSVSDVRGWVYQNIEHLPSMLVVDYPDMLVPSQHFNDKRHEIEKIYVDLVSLKKEFNLDLIVPSQASGDALKAKRVELTMLSEAKAKGHHADNVLALCQTAEEEQDNKMRIVVTKARHTPSKMTIDCVIHRNIMKVEDESAWLKRKSYVSTSRVSRKSVRTKKSTVKTRRTKP